VFFLILSGLVILYPAATRTAGAFSVRTVETKDTAPGQTAKYSKFSHDVPEHKKKECKECHKFPSSNWEKVRPEADAFPDITDYPKHDSCVGCHRKQFFSGPKPVVCSICHTNPGPRDSSRHPFPNPREIYDESPKGKTSFSAFAVNFPHEMHVAMMGSNITDRGGSVFVKAGFKKPVQSETCATCHSILKPQGDSEDEYVTKPPENLDDGFWLKKGTFMAAPIGHTQCFTCHSADSGLSPSPQDCGTCHKLQPKDVKTDFDPAAAAKMDITDKLLIASWRRRTSSATFRHEWASHADTDCTVCHNIASLSTADPKVKAVSITACSGCHITATSDDGGILNYEIDSRNKDPKFQCAKCHLAYGSAPVPETHPNAIKEMGGG
jgi:Pyruvate/2-oxoacid:ferredoxin oxidoreductase delta subunit